MKTIELVIARDGSARLETRGFVGDVCREGSRFLEEALGIRLSETLTSEYHADVQEPAQEHEKA